MRGGYQLINLKHSNFIVDGAGVTIPGTYAIIDRCMKTTKKETIISNYTIDGDERQDSMVRFVPITGGYEGIGTSIKAPANNVIHYFITVTDADLVTITSETVTGSA